MPSFRESLERASLPTIAALTKLPRWVPFLVVLALMVGGVFIKPWGWILLIPVAVFLAWILVLSWPRLAGVERLMRIAVLLLVAVATLTLAVPRT